MRRTRIVIASLAVLLVLVFAARTMLGDFTITLVDFFRIIGGTEIPGATYILMESKLPRAVLGVLVGLAFGVSGAIFQTTLRNPLASPDIIGVSVGASAAAVFAIVTLGERGFPVSVAAVLGAVLISALVRQQAGSVAGNRLVLVGVGLSAALFSLIQYLSPAPTSGTRSWCCTGSPAASTGSTGPRSGSWPCCWSCWLRSCSGSRGPAGWSSSGRTPPPAWGSPRGGRTRCSSSRVLLVALGVAAAGPIAFVAFLAGPIARSLNGGRTTLLGAGLTGAVIVVAADHVAAYLIPDVNFPVGVVTGALGAPFLLWLLATDRTSRRS